MTEDREIRTQPCPGCILCGSDGVFIYRDQRDRLFGAGGSWNFKRCCNRSCGLIWLDPMPLEEDIGKAYAKYYTHQAQAGAKRPGLLKRACELMERGYWAGKYHYPIAGSMLVKGVGKLLYLFPLRRRGADGDVRFLRAVPHGRLLDVGCGSGEWLLFMRALGWQVEGIDFDERAVEIATQSGLNVRCGALEQQSYPSESFNAVILNHVIEHLPDPVGTLWECGRILAPGGKQVVFTPNSSSLGHRFFKGRWRGLEPPRHLHVFSMRSLQQILGQAGFREISVRPQIAGSVIYDSLLLHLGQIGFTAASRRNWVAEAFARFFTVLELCLLNWNPSIADCVGAVAVK
jgi:2-polyprenyl-3-methyl-5-hydroxy-6-metoxy-1,4-benzoquinol methylase